MRCGCVVTKDDLLPQLSTLSSWMRVNKERKEWITNQSRHTVNSHSFIHSFISSRGPTTDFNPKLCQQNHRLLAIRSSAWIRIQMNEHIFVTVFLCSHLNCVCGIQGGGVGVGVCGRRVWHANTNESRENFRTVDNFKSPLSSHLGFLTKKTKIIKCNS